MTVSIQHQAQVHEPDTERRRDTPIRPTQRLQVRLGLIARKHGAKSITDAQRTSTGKLLMSKQAFADRLRTMRGPRKKAEFARFLGLSPAVYQHYEDGRMPRGDCLAAIAERCRVTVPWLLGIDPSSAIGGMKEGEPPKPGSSDLAVREAPRRPFVYPDADDQRPCPRPEDCAFDARLRAIEGAQARMEAQLSTLTQLLGATLAASSRSGAAPESERKAG
jgi:hypothetical protein